MVVSRIEATVNFRIDLLAPGCAGRPMAIEHQRPIAQPLCLVSPKREVLDMKTLTLRTRLLLFRIVVGALLSHPAYSATIVYKVQGSTLPFTLVATNHFHYGSGSSYDTEKKAVQALRKAKRICFEATPTTAEDVREVLALATPVNAADAARDNIPDLTLQKIKAVFSDSGFPAASLDVMLGYRPYFFAYAMNARTNNEFLGANFAGLDDMLRNEAKSQSKTICALESTADIFGPSLSISLEGALSYIDYGLKFIACEQCRKEHADLQHAILDQVYVHGNIEFACTAEDDYAKKYHIGEVLQRSVYDRNKRIVDRMVEEATSQGETIFAIGALHLCGETGVLRQLEERGFRVRPLLHP